MIYAYNKVLSEFVSGQYEFSSMITSCYVLHHLMYSFSWHLYREINDGRKEEMMARWMGGWMSEILSVSLVLTIVWSKISKGSIAHILSFNFAQRFDFVP